MRASAQTLQVPEDNSQSGSRASADVRGMTALPSSRSTSGTAGCPGTSVVTSAGPRRHSYFRISAPDPRAVTRIHFHARDARELSPVRRTRSRRSTGGNGGFDGRKGTNQRAVVM